MLDTFSEIFFQKSHFWGTMRSYDARKISTESLEVSLQDSNIILNFWDDFQFLWPPASTDLTSKTTISGPWELPYSVKNDLTMKKCRFFKVYHTFTIMLQRKKRHLTKVSSSLKRFYDHSRPCWDNFKKLILWYYKTHVYSIIVTNTQKMNFMLQ